LPVRKSLSPELCITHILRRQEEEESGGEVLEACPTTPQDFDAGIAVAFAA
jgi:hypothetical protein